MRIRGWKPLVLLGAILTGVVAAGITGPAVADRPTQRGLTLAADVAEVSAVPVPCAKQAFELRFGNTGKTAVYADAFLEEGAPLTLSRKLVSSYLSPGYTLKVPIDVGAPRGTAPGTYTIEVKARDQKLSVPVKLNSKQYPAAGYGLKDWDVLAQVNGAWQTVASVRGNTAGQNSSTFTPVTATAERVLALASNEGPTYSRIVELEVYAE
jgi:hypothetical protein